MGEDDDDDDDDDDEGDEGDGDERKPFATQTQMLGRLIYSTIYPEVERMFIKCCPGGKVKKGGKVSQQFSLLKEGLVKAC